MMETIDVEFILRSGVLWIADETGKWDVREGKMASDSEHESIFMRNEIGWKVSDEASGVSLKMEAVDA